MATKETENGITQANFDSAIERLEKLIADKNSVDEPAENFKRSWKGSAGFWQKTLRVLEHGAVVLAYGTPAFLTVRGIRNRSAERAAADTVSYTMSASSDGGINVTV